jgi:hypothetical protein
LSNFTTQDKSFASGEGFQDYPVASASKAGLLPKESRVEKLPTIRNISIMGSIYDQQNTSYGIRADGNTLMTYRETGFKLNQNEMKEKLKCSPMNLNNSYTFASSHNKYNRLKDGSWGTSNIHDLPGLKSTGVNLNQQLGRIGIQEVVVTKRKEMNTQEGPQATMIKEQVFGRDEEVEYSASVQKLDTLK